MKKHKHLYADFKHICTWLMVLSILASIIARFILSEQCSLGMIILLSLSGVFFILQTLLSGKEMFHKTSLAIWLFAISSLISAPSDHLIWLILGALIYCIGYTFITAGRGHLLWLLPLHLLALTGISYVNYQLGYALLPDLLFFLGLLLHLPAIKIHTDDQYHPTWGDRIDGRRVRTAPVLEQITSYIMPTRNGANNLFSEAIEITQLEHYVHTKRQQGLSGFGISHAIMAAYVRTIAKYPAINRFIAGQKIYSRGEDVILCMTVKKEMSLSSPDTVIKVHLNPHDNADDVYQKFHNQLSDAKDSMQNTSIDDAAGSFMLLPGFLIRFAFWLLRVLDYCGVIPSFLLEVSPFHGSIYFTSMGSLGINPVYHHLYDFGTIPAFCAFGQKRRVEEISNGNIVKRKYIDLKFNLDERICDGFYYASALKYFIRLLNSPQLLDTPPEVVEKDIP